jgi:hypothetical protein
VVSTSRILLWQLPAAIFFLGIEHAVIH